MSEAGLSAPEEERIQQAADEAYRVLTGDELEESPARRLAQSIRQATLEAPVHALAIAFLLGILVARRR